MVPLMFGPRRRFLGRLLLAALFAGVVSSGALRDLHQPSPTYAVTNGDVENMILTWTNQARVAKGLVPLRLYSPLRSLAEYRAGVMSSTNTMTHTVAGNLSNELTARGIQWYKDGEAIAWTTYAYGSVAADQIFKAWHDASHWPLLMSTNFNYVGVGIVYDSSNGKTWSSMVFTESLDHTAPWAVNVSHSQTGTSVSWSWRGADTKLQTHMSGLMNFDVEYRVDAGTWVVIRSGTTSYSITLTGRASGHSYSVRIRSRDHRGYMSTWTPEVAIRVP